MYIATRTMLAWEMTRVEQSWMPGDLAPPNHKWRPAPPLQSQRLVEGSLNIFLGDIRKDGEDAFQAFLQQPRSDVMGDMRLFRSRAGFQVLVRQSPCTDFVLRVDGTISRASVQLTGTSLGGVQLCAAKFSIMFRVCVRHAREELKRELMKLGLMFSTQQAQLLGPSGLLRAEEVIWRPVAEKTIKKSIKKRLHRKTSVRNQFLKSVFVN